MTTARMLAWLLAALAGIALTLCVVGVYGLVANSVAERQRELGLRMALGATGRHVLTTTAATGVILAVGGAAIGLLLSLAVTRVMQQMVFGPPVNDPFTPMAAAAIVVSRLRRPPSFPLYAHSE